jgi:uncharacterized protein
MKALHMITWVLVVIGALNWGLVGVFHFNLVEAIFKTGTLTRVIYILVGLSAIWEIFTHWSHCKMCGTKPGMNQPAM